MAILNSRLTATKDIGTPVAIAGTSEGHLEVALHSPLMPFGALNVAELHPIFQQDAVYGLLSSEHVTAWRGFGSSASAYSNMLAASTGTASTSFGLIESRKRLRYRAGQGSVARFTGIFTAGEANAKQRIGVGTSEAGYYFGYSGAEFGIWYVNGGVRQITRLTITNGSGGAETITMNLNGTATTFDIAAGSATSVAYQIASRSFSSLGYTVEQRGTQVWFVAIDSEPKNGAFSFSSTGTAAGGFLEQVAGVSATETHIPKADWNGDKLDGTGASGVTINPELGNIYQIDMQYLGFGVIVFKCEVSPANGNNAYWATVHTIRNPNTLTAVHTTQPSFPFRMEVRNTDATSGTTTVKCASYAGFTAGKKVLNGQRSSFVNSRTSTTTSFVPLFTVRNDLVYGINSNRANQSVGYLLSVSGAARSINGITTFYLLKNCTLSAGIPSFAEYATNSVFYWDTAATACTFTNSQLVWSTSVSEAGQFVFSFTDDIELQPGETLTLAVRSVTQTAVCVGQLNFREDQ